MTVSVRLYEERDREAVIAVWAEVFPDGPARNAPEAMIARKRDREHDLFWVAEVDGAVVGAVVAGYDGVRGWLYHLGVVPQARRSGAGTALVRSVELRLRDLGCDKLNLQVRETNLGVMAFYESLGWSRDPAVSMGKVLATG